MTAPSGPEVTVGSASGPGHAPAADPVLRLCGVSVRYDSAWIGDNVDLDVRPGEVTLLLGPSGCGKSTLMLTLPGLVPHSLEADLRGQVVRADGVAATQVGMVFQDPDAQVVTRSLLDEVCFGLENVLVPADQVEHRALAALAQVGLAADRAGALRDPATLSGGGRQRLALACALALDPVVLVLDEPTANLDPVASAELYQTLARLRTAGRAVVLVEHELDDALPLADRVVVLDRHGAIVHDGPPREVIGRHARELCDQGIWLPTAAEVALRLGLDGPGPDGQGQAVPVTVDDLLAQVDSAPCGWEEPPARTAYQLPETPERADEPPAVEVTDLRVVLGGQVVLDGIDLTVPAGELLAVAGVNGAGKSTLTRAVAGLVPVAAGAVRLDGVQLDDLDARAVGDLVGYVFQNPEHQFVTHTVVEELAYGLRVRRRPEDETQAAVEVMLDRFDLARYRGTNPFRLSHGEKRRLSVATALITSPKVLVLDEPTFGQDRARATQIVDLVRELNADGITVLLVTHDLQLVADHADRVAVLADGRLLEAGPTRDVLCHDHVVAAAGLRLPPVHRVARALAARHPGWAGVYRSAQVQTVPTGAREARA